MRYRLISTEWERGENWVNQQVASFRHAEDAIKVCGGLGVPAYVLDTLEDHVIYRSN